MSPFAAWTLTQEARALQTRLARVRPFATARADGPGRGAAAAGAERDRGLPRRRPPHPPLARCSNSSSGCAGQGRRASNAQAQRRFSILRLKFNAVLTQFDLFSDVITQRSEHDTGVWLSGLDVASADALTLRGRPGRRPAADLLPRSRRGRGDPPGPHAAAGRRHRTRSPIIRVPRERMVGSGIASSLFHEVGHQADALLGISESLRPVLRGMQRPGQDDAQDSRRCGSTWNAASRRSSPTSSRWRALASRPASGSSASSACRARSCFA